MKLRTASPRTDPLTEYQGVVSLYGMGDEEGRDMKGITVLALFLLAGCGSYQTMEQLEAHALSTGDWTAVERRERIIQKRKMRDGIRCPPGMTGVCESQGASNRCSCIKSEAIRTLFDY